MSGVPVITARELIRVLKSPGFAHTRTRGSHKRFEYPDGRQVTVPDHKGRDLPKGLLRQIVTVDIGISMDSFVEML